MNNIIKLTLVTLIFLSGIVAGSYLTSDASASVSIEQDKDLHRRHNASLDSEPDGWSVRAISSLLLDLTQAVNGDSEHKVAREEAKQVLAQLQGLGFRNENKHEDYLKASRFFISLEKYTARRGCDKNTRNSCLKASELFEALAKMENDSLSEKEQEREAGVFFYCLADLFELERNDQTPEIASSGQIQLFRSLGDLCKAESSGSKKESKTAIAGFFRSLGVVATEDK